jgi:hypothetical protein
MEDPREAEDTVKRPNVNVTLIFAESFGGLNVSQDAVPFVHIEAASLQMDSLWLASLRRLLAPKYKGLCILASVMPSTLDPGVFSSIVCTIEAACFNERAYHPP